MLFFYKSVIIRSDIMENNTNDFKKDLHLETIGSKDYFDYLISLKNGEANEPVDYTPSFIYL